MGLLSVSDIVTLAVAGVGVLGNIIYVSVRYGSFEARIEAKVTAIENDVKADKVARDNLATSVNAVDRRVQGVEIKMSGVEVKIDNILDNVDEVKKIVIDRLTKEK